MCALADAPGPNPLTGQTLETGEDPPASAGALNPAPAPSPVGETNSRPPVVPVVDFVPAESPSEAPSQPPPAAENHTKSGKPPGENPQAGVSGPAGGLYDAAYQAAKQVYQSAAFTRGPEEHGRRR